MNSNNGRNLWTAFGLDFVFVQYFGLYWKN